MRLYSTTTAILKIPLLFSFSQNIVQEESKVDEALIDIGRFSRTLFIRWKMQRLFPWNTVILMII